MSPRTCRPHAALIAACRPAARTSRPVEHVPAPADPSACSFTGAVLGPVRGSCRSPPASSPAWCCHIYPAAARASGTTARPQPGCLVTRSTIATAAARCGLHPICQPRQRHASSRSSSPAACSASFPVVHTLGPLGLARRRPQHQGRLRRRHCRSTSGDVAKNVVMAPSSPPPCTRAFPDLVTRRDDYRPPPPRSLRRARTRSRVEAGPRGRPGGPRAGGPARRGHRPEENHALSRPSSGSPSSGPNGSTVNTLARLRQRPRRADVRHRITVDRL